MITNSSEIVAITTKIVIHIVDTVKIMESQRIVPFLTIQFLLQTFLVTSRHCHPFLAIPLLFLTIPIDDSPEILPDTIYAFLRVDKRSKKYDWGNTCALIKSKRSMESLYTYE